MDVQGIVGPQHVSDGSPADIRQGKDSEVIVQDAHGRYYEASLRGKIWVASTAVAGVAPGTALSTTPPLALWNPPGSGVNLSIILSALGFVSGTLGAGSLVYAQVNSQTTAPTGGTELVPVSCLIGGTGARVGRAFQGSTLASTPALLRPGHIIGTTPTTPASAPSKDLLDGEFTVAPGGVLVLQGVAAAGTSPLVLISLSWEETAQ